MGQLILILIGLVLTAFILTLWSRPSREPRVIYVEIPRQRSTGCLGPIFFLMLLTVFVGLMLVS